MTWISHRVGLDRRSLTAAMLVAGLCVPMPLLAHAHLVKSLPAAGARLEDAPTLLRLWFSEAPELALTQITLVDERGDTIPLGAVSRDQTGPRAVAVAIPSILHPGSYRVLWRTAAADGHPTHGQFTFSVLASVLAARAGMPVGGPSRGHVPASQASPASTTPIPSSAKPGATPFDALSPMYVVIRWLSLTALVIVIGTVAFRLFVASAPNGIANDTAIGATVLTRTTQIGLWAAAVLGAATLARLAAQLAVLDGTTMTVLLGHTRWGRGWLLQAGATILTALGFAWAWQSPQSQRRGWAIATVGTLILAATPALSGHAIATPQLATLAVLSDTGHVLGAGGWLGSLFVLITVGLPALRRLDPAARGAETATVVNRFSGLALLCAALTVVTGTTSAWIHLGAMAALWQTGYGRTLLIKLSVFVLVLAVGGYNWRVVRPTLDRAGSSSIPRLHRSARFELVLGAAMIAITAVLVAIPVPL